MKSNIARIVLFIFAAFALAAILVANKRQDQIKAREQLRALDIEVEKYDDTGEIHVRTSNNTKLVSINHLTDLIIRAKTLDDDTPFEPTVLDVSDSPNLESLEGAWRLRKLHSLYAINCPKLNSLEGIAGLPNLTQLVVQECENLTDVSAVRGMPSLITIDFTNSSGFTELTTHDLLNLENLYLTNCRSLQSLDLSKQAKLNQLFVDSCVNLTEITHLDRLTQLTDLDVSNCDNLQHLKGLEKLTSLVVFDMRNVELPDFSIISQLPKLKSLRLGGQSNFNSMEPFSGLTELEEIYFEACPNLASLKGMPTVTRSVGFVKCDGLITIAGIKNSPELKQVELSGCKNLKYITELEHLGELVQLNLAGCRKITDIAQLVKNPKLQIISLGGSGVTPSSIAIPIKNGPNKGSIILKPPLNKVFSADRTVFDFASPQ